MGRLIYSAITSLDGYVDDRDGGFDWAAPAAAVHTHVNDGERDVGCYLYGRRIYQVMKAWQTVGDPADLAAPNQPETQEMAEYAAIWRAADKIVFSTSLSSVETPRTELRRSFAPAEVSRLKQTSEEDLSIGGPTLAEAALRTGLVDEIRLYLNPVVVGGGTAALPDALRLELSLIDEYRFASGVVYLAYRVGS